MGWLSLLAVAAALAMDAFAVAIVVGLSPRALTRRRVFRLSFHFGLFQALMPVLGWTAGRVIYRYIAQIDHWVAFGLLALAGGRMTVGAMRDQEHRRPPGDPTSGWDLILLSIATSIDALAVGLSLAMIGSKILIPSLVIGAVASTLTAVGMALGREIGTLWGKRVEVIGGIVLIGIGVKILMDHLTGC